MTERSTGNRRPGESGRTPDHILVFSSEDAQLTVTDADAQPIGGAAGP